MNDERFYQSDGCKLGNNTMECKIEIMESFEHVIQPAQRDLFLRNAQVLIMTFSPSAKSSFDDLKDIYQVYQQITKVNYPPVVLVANNTEELESERIIMRNEGESLANKWKCPYFEIDCKYYHQIQKVIHQACREASKLYEGNYFKIGFIGGNKTSSNYIPTCYRNGCLENEINGNFDESFLHTEIIEGLFIPNDKQSLFSRIGGLFKSNSKSKVKRG